MPNYNIAYEYIRIKCMAISTCVCSVYVNLDSTLMMLSTTSLTKDEGIAKSFEEKLKKVNMSMRFTFIFTLS